MNKIEKYQELYSKAEALLSGESNELANLSNFCALIHNEFGFWWTGFYLIENEELVLGPFQGPVACTRIAFGKGVCGTAWEQAKSIVVPDVHAFEGHIACSSESNSEIVVPYFRHNNIRGVFDIDSKDFNTFDAIDKQYLEKLLSLLN